MNKIRGGAIAVAALLTCLAGAPVLADDAAIACKEKVDLISVKGLTNEDNAALADLTVAQEAASTALVQNDAETALNELQALWAKVMEISSGSSPAISQDDAQTLLKDVDAAISCVQAL